jgi:hypothetical protein
MAAQPKIKMAEGPNQPPARKTRIVSTLGPASFKRTRELMIAGTSLLFSNK